MQSSQSFSSAGSTTWTVPTGVASVYVECWGAGGGGAGAGNDVNYDGNYGGGGGGYAAARVPVIEGSTYTVFVGTGGAGGTNSLSNGSAGGVSWAINSASVIATGGGGAVAQTSAGTGGSGASGSVRYSGGTGGTPTGTGTVNVRGGGGGGGAGTTANGANAGTAPNPGAGGAGNPGAGRGAGGSGSATVPGNGSAGTSAGGGGGGATTNNTVPPANRNGGSGSAGYVLITWDIPNYPVALDTGTMTVMDSTTVINPAFFPVSRSVAPTSNSFSTLLPDPYYVGSQSADISVSVNGTSSSLSVFTVPTRQEKQYYMSEALLGVQSAAATTTGVPISIGRANLADGFFSIITATGTNNLSVLNQGSKDAKTTATASAAVANNVTVPILTKGLFSNSTTNGTFSNTTFLETSASTAVKSTSGSVFYQHFLGFSSSLAPFTSSQSPIALVSGTLDSITRGDVIADSVMPARTSLWNTASLLTSQVISSTTAGVWATVFTLTGMTDGKRYLVNHFLKMVATSATAGIWVRAVSASNFNGFLYGLDNLNNTNLSANTICSSGSNSIVNTKPTNSLSTSTSGRLFLGEYTLVKVAGQTPTIDIQSEVAANQCYANSGSFVMWREIS